MSFTLAISYYSLANKCMLCNSLSMGAKQMQNDYIGGIYVSAQSSAEDTVKCIKNATKKNV